jgi:hypothetical protein
VYKNGGGFMTNPHIALFVWFVCSVIVFFRTLARGYGRDTTMFYTIISPIICAIVIFFWIKDFFVECRNKIEGRNREKSMERKRPA